MEEEIVSDPIGSCHQAGKDPDFCKLTHMTMRFSRAVRAISRPVRLSAWPTIAALVGLIVLSGQATSGELVFREYCNPDGKNCSVNVNYSGPIESADVEKFRSILGDAKRRTDFSKQIMLDSPGGDVDAALKIGKLIRASHLTTASKECYSSCVIVLAGGVARWPMTEFAGLQLGKVGIHRPYTMMGVASYEKHREKFNKLEREIKKYLREGGVSERLWDDMIKTPPESMMLLDQKQLQAYGLSGLDPAYADYLDSKEASRYGVSKIEYLKRKAAIKVLCDSDAQVLADVTGQDLAKCRENVYRGHLPK